MCVWCGGGWEEGGGRECASFSAGAATVRHPEAATCSWEANLCGSKMTSETVARDEADAKRTLPPKHRYSGQGAAETTYPFNHSPGHSSNSADRGSLGCIIRLPCERRATYPHKFSQMSSVIEAGVRAMPQL